MIVIGHYNEAVDYPTGAVAAFAQGFQESPAIQIVPADGFEVIASIHHVVNGPGKFDAWRSRHACFIAARLVWVKTNNKKRTDPFLTKSELTPF